MSIKDKIKELMQPGVKLTADEVAGALDLPVLSVRPRVCELSFSRSNGDNHGRSFLKPIAMKLNRHGNNMIVWTRRL